jgi:hypothetical protein
MHQELGGNMSVAEPEKKEGEELPAPDDPSDPSDTPQEDDGDESENPEVVPESEGE